MVVIEHVDHHVDRTSLTIDEKGNPLLRTNCGRRFLPSRPTRQEDYDVHEPATSRCAKCVA